MTTRMTARSLAGGALAILATAVLVASCARTSDQPTPTPPWETRTVPELAAILADPVAATDCEVHAGAESICGWYARDAAEALGEKGDPAAVPALVAAIESSDTGHEAVDAAWVALGKIDGPDVIAYLVRYITEWGPSSTSRVDRHAELLGQLGGVEHNQILVDVLHGFCASTGVSNALVTINRADATPLLKYLKASHTVDVYGPLIRIGQAGTEKDLVAAFKKFAYKEMAQCFLNSGNPTLERPANDWVKAHGYTILRISGGSSKWGAG